MKNNGKIKHIKNNFQNVGVKMPNDVRLNKNK